MLYAYTVIASNGEINYDLPDGRSDCGRESLTRVFDSEEKMKKALYEDYRKEFLIDFDGEKEDSDGNKLVSYKKYCEDIYPELLFIQLDDYHIQYETSFLKVE